MPQPLQGNDKGAIPTAAQFIILKFTVMEKAKLLGNSGMVLVIIGLTGLASISDWQNFYMCCQMQFLQIFTKILSNMVANQIYATTYRLEIKATRENLDNVENFMEAIADISVTLYTIPDVFIITVASDMLNTTQLCNVAIRFFGKEDIL